MNFRVELVSGEDLCDRRLQENENVVISKLSKQTVNYETLLIKQVLTSLKCELEGKVLE